MPSDQMLGFGPFRLIPSRRVLLEGEQPIKLSSRAFDILVSLVERGGEVVSVAELMARAWPKSVVEQGALRVHIFGLRKALGDGRDGQRYIVNVPQQGYCFVAPVEKMATTVPPDTTQALQPLTSANQPVVSPTSAGALPPALVTRVLGRGAVLAELSRDLLERRCTTLVGTGGIGKTTLAVALAHGLSDAFDRQVVFTSLAPLEDQRLVPIALASALGVTTLASDPIRGLCAYLRDRRMLIVLDNCEHLIEAVAALAEQLLASAPQVHLLVTSREPLRVHGEWVQRIAALELPPPSAEIDTAAVRRYSALDLFVERVRASVDSFEPTSSDWSLVADICRAVDGIPLAIELAAAGVERLGVRGVAAHLGDQLSVLTRGRRTALPRHQTLRAALDWSYGLLSPSEQAMLRHLSVFKSRFTLESALAVCCPSSEASPVSASADDLFNLMSKSLLSSDIGSEPVQYWLLETTRQYARDRLSTSGESQELARRHAAHTIELARHAESDRDRIAADDWSSRYAHTIDDVRAALAWAFDPGDGDVALGVSLAAASAPLWFALSRMAEYMNVAQQALTAMEQGGLNEPLREMVLREAHAHALWHLSGACPTVKASFERVLELAEAAGSDADRMRAIWGLWLNGNTAGEYRESIPLAERFGALAGTGPSPARTVHHRMMALSTHYSGQHEVARTHAQWVLSEPVSANRSARNSGFHFDQWVAANTSLARIRWIQGYPDQALGHAQEAIDRAIAIGHLLSLFYAVSVGCAPAAMWVGDWAEADRYTQMLEHRSEEYSLPFWQAFGAGYRLVLDRHQGGTSGLEVLVNPCTSMHLLDTLCSIDPGLPDERMLERGVSGTAAWCAPELMRIKGERLAGGGDHEAAERMLRMANELAQQHQAGAWELRCAISLARFFNGTDQLPMARGLLESVLLRFREGLGSADVRAATALLRDLG